jgi:5-oxoprolinase (ATP-hydrolysing) subunit A
MAVLLNIDLAERVDEPEELYALTHVASLACGGHAGDADTLARALARCRAHGVTVAAHPSYPDREGFGRRRLAMPREDVASSVAAQCRLLAGLAVGLKPHGALYHAADEDEALAAAIVDAARAALPGLRFVIGPAGGGLARAAAIAGLDFWREGFADRAADEIAPGRWRLWPRDVPGAVIVDPEAAVARARAIAPLVDTLCVHGDTPDAVAIARAVRGYLDATPTPMGQETPVPPRPQ